MAENQDLLHAMELCGHFLYHRRGGKRGQKRILRILSTEGAVSQKQIQDRLEIQSGSLSETVIKLESNGMITREKDENDKRNRVLKITEKGRQEYERMLVVNKEQEKIIFQALNEEEQEQLLHLLDQLLQDWKLNFNEILSTHRKG